MLRPVRRAGGGRYRPTAAPAALVARRAELFYVSPANALMRVGVERGTSWTATTPEGQRFVVLKDATDPDAAPPQFVVQHFDESLARLVPTD